MFNSDYIDSFVDGYVVRQRMDERIAEAAHQRLVNEYRAAHPDQGWKPRAARLLRRTADRLSPEPSARPRLRAVGR